MQEAGVCVERRQPPVSPARSRGEITDDGNLPYYGGSFDGDDEVLQLVHGTIGKSMGPVFVERIQRIAQDFAKQHLADQKLPEDMREGYTLLLSMRRWEFAAFTALRR